MKIAPSFAQANIAATASGAIGMNTPTVSPVATPSSSRRRASASVILRSSADDTSRTAPSSPSHSPAAASAPNLVPLGRLAATVAKTIQEAPPEQAPAPSRPGHRRWRLPVALLAALSLIVAAGAAYGFMIYKMTSLNQLPASKTRHIGG